MPAEAKVDNRVFTGLCRIHQQCRVWWRTLHTFLHTWKCKTKRCELCSGERPVPTFRDLFIYAVCPVPGLSADVDISLLSTFPLKKACLTGDCDACGGQYQVLPSCKDPRHSEKLVQTAQYDRLTWTTKANTEYTQLKLVPTELPMATLWGEMNDSLSPLLHHQYGDLWIKSMLHSIDDSSLGVGDCFIWVDYPVRQELFVQASIVEEEYPKSNSFLLVLTIMIRGAGRVVQHHCAVYVGESSLAKGQAVLEEALKDAVS